MMCQRQRTGWLGGGAGKRESASEVPGARLPFRWMPCLGGPASIMDNIKQKPHRFCYSASRETMPKSRSMSAR